MPASFYRGILPRMPGAAAAASIAGAATLALVPVAAAAAATVPVTMHDFTFSAPLLTVTVGDTVTWTNHDKALHDATTTKAPVSFGSPLLKTGEFWSYTLTTPGLYQYNCSIHPKMVAAIQALGSSEATPETPATGPDHPGATDQPRATKRAASSEHAKHAAPADDTSAVVVALPSAAPITTPSPAPTKAGSRKAKAASAVAVAAPPATTPEAAPAAASAPADRIDLTPKLVGGGITVAVLVAGLFAYGVVAGRRTT